MELAHKELTQVLNDYMNLGGQSQSVTKLRECLLKVSPETRLNLVSTVVNNRTKETILHRASVREDVNLLRCVLTAFSPEEKWSLLMNRDKKDWTVYHAASAGYHAAATKCILDLLSFEQKRELVKVLYIQLTVPLHYAIVRERSIPIIKLTLDLFTEEEIFQQITQTAYGHLGLSPIQNAMHQRSIVVVKLILDSLSTALRIQAIDHALAVPAGREHGEMVSFIEQYRLATMNNMEHSEKLDPAAQSEPKHTMSETSMENSFSAQSRRSKRLASKQTQQPAAPSAKRQR